MNMRCSLRPRSQARSNEQSKPDSDLASAADGAIPTRIRGTPGPVPGTANFLGSMLGLTAIAAELGARIRSEVFRDADVVAALDAVDAFALPVLDAGTEAGALTPPFF